jgi:hypothetical protein
VIKRRDRRAFPGVNWIPQTRWVEACRLNSSGIEELTPFAVDAVRAYRAGCAPAAQALAANIFTTVIHVQLTLEYFGQARSEFERLAPDKTTFRYLRAAAIYAAARSAVDEYYGRPDESASCAR